MTDETPVRSDERLVLPRRVMVAFDASPAARDAARYALALAHRIGAELIFVSVLDVTTTGADPQPLIEDAPVVAEIENELRQLVVTASAQGVAARDILRYGPPLSTLLQLAEAERADLIVCGTHGRHGLRRLVLGSVAETLARKATCPVLLVRQHCDGSVA